MPLILKRVDRSLKIDRALKVENDKWQLFYFPVDEIHKLTSCAYAYVQVYLIVSMAVIYWKALLQEWEVFLDQVSFLEVAP